MNHICNGLNYLSVEVIHSGTIATYDLHGGAIHARGVVLCNDCAKLIEQNTVYSVTRTGIGSVRKVETKV